MPGVLQMDPHNGVSLADAEEAVPAMVDEDQPIEEFVVVNQEVSIEVNFREQSIQGESKISIYLINLHDPPDEVALDARQCDIDTSKIRVNGKAVPARYQDPYEALDLPPSWDLTANNFPVLKNRMKNLLPRRRRDLPVENREQSGCNPADRSLRVSLRPRQPPGDAAGKLKVRVSSTALPNGSSFFESGTNGASASASDDKDGPTNGLYEIVIPFRTTHVRDGLHFVGVEENDARFPHVYTRHSPEPGMAACIFPCIDDPGSRCFWTIHVKCPRTLGDALMQPLVSHQQADDVAGTAGAGAAKSSAEKGRSAGRGQRELQMTEEDKLLDMTVVCSGNLVGEKLDEQDETKKIMTFEITDHGSAAQHIGFAVGPFEHVDLFTDFRSEEADEKLGASALKIHGYCLPRRGALVRNSCVAMANAADEFAMTYGRYPFESFKLCFVDDMVAETTPLLSFALCSNRLLFSENIIDRDIEVTRKLVHALAYQYFGAYIVPNQRTEMWLTVGIAYYMTDLYLCKLCGNNDYRFRIKTMSDRLAEEDRGRPSLHDLGTYAFLGDFEMEFMALKAPLVLFILDKRLTKAAGSASASLARVISKIISKANTSGWGDNNNEIISSESFRRVCQKTSQYQLDNFWSQWVLGSGCPWLSVKQRFNRKRLCVEIGVLQVQEVHAQKPRAMRAGDFWRELVEWRHGHYSRKVQRLFTGPMTIRIHEANGTPYEHIVEIREDSVFTGGAKFDIPYNTKYKRLKRNRRQRERAAAAAAADPNGENGEDMIVYSLGDRLEGAEDMAKWELIDWSEQDEKNMDQESYEWIRIDSDFEWLVKIHTNMPSWMYLSQLQQDRDIVAQQDTLLYLSRIREHAMSATILTRTLYDERYFYGLRTMAADILARQTWKAADTNGGGGGGGMESNGSGGGELERGDAGGSTAGGEPVVFRGLHQLMQTFREFFFYPDMTSRPNDFSDKRQYLVQCAMVDAIAKVQFEGRHPYVAQKFLLDLLRFNDNSQNTYSDHMYVAKLLEALATSLCSTGGAGTGSGPGPGRKKTKKAADMDMVLTFDDAMSDGDDFDLGGGGGGGGGASGRGGGHGDADRMQVDSAERQMLEDALAEIERYRRMDEWVNSYQNVWTTAALECKKRLMKAGVIPVDALEFVRYLQDGTTHLVQIKAYEALVQLGLFLRPVILRLFLTTMATHSSPFVRDRLFKLFCEGVAGIAFGEHDGGGSAGEASKEGAAVSGGGGSAADSKGTVAATTGGDDDDDDDDNGGLIIEQGDAVIKKHQEEHARKENLGAALAALRQAVADNKELLSAMWAAVLSPVTGSTEKRNLMELLEVMFEGELSLLLTVKHPTMWTVARRAPNGFTLDFKQIQRPLTAAVPEPVVATATAAAAATPALPMPGLPTSLGAGATTGAATTTATATTTGTGSAGPARTPVPGLAGTGGGSGAAETKPARTALPAEPRKTGTPKIKLQTNRISISSGGTGVAAAGSSTPMLVRKPSVSAAVVPSTPARAPTPTSAPARTSLPTTAATPAAPETIGESISVLPSLRGALAPTSAAATNGHGSNVASARSPQPQVSSHTSQPASHTSQPASHISHTSQPASHVSSHTLHPARPATGTSGGSGNSPALARTPLTGKRKREARDDDSRPPRHRKLLKISIPRGYQRKLSPRASHWLETARASPAAAAATAANGSGSGSIRAAGPSSVHSRHGTPKSSSSSSRASATPGPGFSQQQQQQQQQRHSSHSHSRQTSSFASHHSYSHHTKESAKTDSAKAMAAPSASSSASSAGSDKPARKPLPTGGRAAASPAPSPTPAPAPAPAPAPSRNIVIKFKTKPTS